jgi:phage shock protein A
MTNTPTIAELLTRIANLESRLEELQIMYDNKCDALADVKKEYAEYRSEVVWGNDRNQMGCF